MGWKNGKYRKPLQRDSKQRNGVYMRTPKYHLYLTDEECSLAMQVLVSLKNKLIRESKYTGAVDELIIKLSKTKLKKVRTA